MQNDNVNIKNLWIGIKLSIPHNFIFIFDI